MGFKKPIRCKFLQMMGVGMGLVILTASVLAITAASEAAKVVTWFDSGAAWRNTVKQLDAAFAKDHPEIKITWVTQDPGEISTKLLMAFSINEGPDVCVSHTPRTLGAELELEAWENLAPMIESDPELKDIINQLRPGSVDIFGRGDRIWGLPHAVMMDDIFVRKSWLENVGWGKPWPYVEDWNDFLELAKKFTFGDPDGDGKKNTFGWGEQDRAGTQIYTAWRRWVYASGLPPAAFAIAEDGSPQWNSQEGIRAAKQMQEMMKAGVMPADVTNWTHKEYYAAVGGGVLGMGRAGPWNIKTFDKGMDDGDYDITLFPPPVKGAERYARQWANSVHLSASTEVMEAAYTWFKFLMSKAAQEILFQTVGQAARVDLDWERLIDNPRLLWFFDPQAVHPGATPKYVVNPREVHAMYATATTILGEHINKLLVDFSADAATELAAAEERYQKEWERWKAEQGK